MTNHQPTTQIPTSEEIRQALGLLSQKYQNQDKLHKIIDTLYTQLVAKSALEQKQAIPQKRVAPLFKRPMKEQKEVEQVTEVEIQDAMITVYPNPRGVRSKNEIEIIQYYQQKLAIELFVKQGYGLQAFRKQIHNRGGLFEITESRYKNIAINFVTEAFGKLEEFLQANRYSFQRINKSILLNCTINFSEPEVKVFHSFIILANNQDAPEMKISKKYAIQFYQNTKKLLETKMEGERLIYSRNHFLPAPGRRARKVQSPLAEEQSSKTQKEIYQQFIIQKYIQWHKISDTKEQFEKTFGFHQQYSMHRQLQNVIFRFCRKTLRDIQEYCNQYHKTLPQIAQMNDPRIKQILTSTKGITTRVKLLLVCQAFRKKQKCVILKGNSIYVNNWQLQPNQLNEVDLVLLVDVIKEINKFFDGREGDEITLFDGKPPYHKVEKRRNKFSMDYDPTIPNQTKRNRKKAAAYSNYQDLDNNQHSEVISSDQQ